VLSGCDHCVPSQFGTDLTNQSMVSSRYVVVADLVVASFHQTHIHHLFNIVIESCCHSLVDHAVIVWLVLTGCAHSVPSQFGKDPKKHLMVSRRYVVVADAIVA
jgi:hypothetical protein